MHGREIETAEERQMRTGRCDAFMHAYPPVGRCQSCRAQVAEDALTVTRARIAALEQAIRTHRDQRADDRCIEDDDRLYAALGDDIPCDRRVGDKDAMLANCRRFIERRCEGGGWPSYAAQERRIAALATLREVVARHFALGLAAGEASTEIEAALAATEPNPGSESEATR